MTTRRINEKRYLHGRGVSNHLDICVIKSNLGSSMDTLVSCNRNCSSSVRVVQRTVLRDARGSVRLSPSFCGGRGPPVGPLPQIRHVKCLLIHVFHWSHRNNRSNVFALSRDSLVSHPRPPNRTSSSLGPAVHEAPHCTNYCHQFALLC